MIAMMLSLIFYSKHTHRLRSLYTLKNSRKERDMIKNTRIRRATALVLVALGAVLMFLAPEVWPGALLLGSGVVLELVGIALGRRAD